MRWQPLSRREAQGGDDDGNRRIRLALLGHQGDEGGEQGREIYVNADEARVSDGGALTFVGDKGYPVLVIAAGRWLAVYAASCVDGAAVAVAHWAGEVSR